MKRMIVAVLCMLLFTFGAFGGAANALSENGDDLHYTEKTLYGSVSEAEGLCMESIYHYDSRLFWNSRFGFGENFGYSTDLSFYTFGKKPVSVRNYVGITADTHVEYGCNFDIPASEQEGLARAYKELYDICENGKRVSKTVYLKDYYEYYPLLIRIDLPGVVWHESGYLSLSKDGYEQQVSDRFSEFFRIKVLEDDMRKIDIEKGPSGGMSIGSSHDGNTFGFYTESAYTDTTCFFYMNNRTSEDDIISYELVPGGYGIYSFGFKPNTVGGAGVDADSLKNVYPLEEEVRVYDMAVSGDNKELILWTEENGTVFFNVINIADMELIQRIELFEGGYTSLYKKDGYYVMYASGNIVLVERCENGKYRLAISVPMASKINADYAPFYGKCAMAYNGEKLAVSSSLYNNEQGRIELCGFWIAVYSAEGLVYYGEYGSGLSANPSPNTSFNCRPLGADSKKLYWD